MLCKNYPGPTNSWGLELLSRWWLVSMIKWLMKYNLCSSKRNNQWTSWIVIWRAFWNRPMQNHSGFRQITDLNAGLRAYSTNQRRSCDAVWKCQCSSLEIYCVSISMTLWLPVMSWCRCVKCGMMCVKWGMTPEDSCVFSDTKIIFWCIVALLTQSELTMKHWKWTCFIYA